LGRMSPCQAVVERRQRRPTAVHVRGAALEVVRALDVVGPAGDDAQPHLARESHRRRELRAKPTGDLRELLPTDRLEGIAHAHECEQPRCQGRQGTIDYRELQPDGIEGRDFGCMEGTGSPVMATPLAGPGEATFLRVELVPLDLSYSSPSSVPSRSRSS